jgi:hypothetical protein
MPVGEIRVAAILGFRTAPILGFPVFRDVDPAVHHRVAYRRSHIVGRRVGHSHQHDNRRDSGMVQHDGDPGTAAKVINVAVLMVGFVAMLLAAWREREQPNAVVEHVVSTGVRITPAQGTQGRTMEVTITTATAGLTHGSIPQFGPGITVLDSHNTSEQALVAHIRIDAPAPPGTRRIWVNTGPQIALDDSPQGALSVIAGIPTQR